MGLLNFHRDKGSWLKCHVTLLAKKPPSGAYPVSLTTLGDHIRKRRLDAKLLQKEVAATLGVDTMTVNNWERNRCRPRLYLFLKIIQFLGYTPFPNNEESTLGEAIKAYRLRHGLSQKKMARALGIDPTTLARWEKTKTTPSKKLGRRLSDLLGTKDFRAVQNSP
jgi:transcriptional regulator with XRE-family HTH domain